MRRIAPLLVLLSSPALAAEPMPKVPDGWTIALIKQAPEIAYPTAIVAAPDGTIYLGQDPMDMPGPVDRPIDSVVAIKDGKVTTFADKLHAVMGLEWADDTLYVVHAPFLSAFTDADRDGRADRRVDLITGLGPANPAFSGMNDHIASGVRLGVDGFLYVAIGSKGIPKGLGKDGTTIRMKGGGVIRVRPDGTNPEVVSTGECNPLSVALTARDEIFTYGNDDDSKRWPNSLTHHIVGGHHGYPDEFLTAPWRCLPITGGQFGGAGAQAILYEEDGLEPKYRGNLFACDWGTQAVYRYELSRSGATFKVVKREPFVTKGDLGDFRPFSIAVGGDRDSLLLVDWAYNGWLAEGPKTGRVYRLSLAEPERAAGSGTGSDRPRSAPVPATGPSGPVSVAVTVADLDHLSARHRREARLALARRGDAIVPEMARVRKSGLGPAGRVEGLWTLDSINTLTARAAIREALDDSHPDVRAQAARSSGIRRDRLAATALAKLLTDEDPTVRREAAIALGRIGDRASAQALYDALGDPDRFVSWSVRQAIRGMDAYDATAITAALRDPKRRDDALALVDESWSIHGLQALQAAFAATTDPLARARILANLAGQYRKYPEWSGAWYGTNPVAGPYPSKTLDWDKQGMQLVLDGLARGMSDGDATVRRQAILGLAGVGPEVAGTLLAALPRETDSTNRAALIASLGRWGEPRAVPILGQILASRDQPLTLRAAALDALAGINNRQAFNLRFSLLFDPTAPPELIARALPALGRSGALPPNDLADFLENRPTPVRVAALEALRGVAKLPAEIHDRIIAQLDDPDAAVRDAAVDAVARLRLAGAVPKLIDLAKDGTTRPGAIVALARMPDPRALQVYLSALDDRSPDLRRAGQVALLRIRPQVADELKRRAGAGEFHGPSAEAVERVLADFRPVTAWKVIGPFPRSTGPLFLAETSIDSTRSHPGFGGRPVRWADRGGDSRTGLVNLSDLGGPGEAGGFGFDAGHSPDLVAFALAEVPSDADREALFLVGASGPVVVAVNGAVVLNSGETASQAGHAELIPVRARLVKGANRLLIRSRQGALDWAFTVQVSAPADSLFPARKGIESVRDFAMTHRGDPRKGEELFFDPKGLNCAKCHAAGGRGSTQAGPDLTGLASKYDKAEIIRSILEPSSRLAPGFVPAVVARRDGSVVTGVVRGETDREVILVDAEARSIPIPRADVGSRRPGTVSIMPAGLVDGISPVDFADLVAFLLSLKSTRP